MINYQGLLIGLAAFIIIGLFHPLVIKVEYYFGKKVWWVFFLPGVFFVTASLFMTTLFSIISSCIGFGLFWSTAELFMQHNRVLKGQAKRNPKRDYNE